MAGRRARRGLLAVAGAALGLPAPAQAQITVLSRQPARHAVAVARMASVTVGFSQPITAASAAGLRVYGTLLQGKRAGSVSGGGTAALTFTPSQGYAPGEVLSVSVPASLAGTGGGAVARQVYQFTAATGGAGKGFFLDTARVGNTTSRDQVLGDLDNDGDLDLLTTGALFGCRVFLNDGTGKYIFKTGFPTGEVPAGLALADVNQDGYLDVLSGDSKNNLLAVRINDGTGDFFTPVSGYQNAPVGAGVSSVAAGDLDGDGDQDFVTANASGSSATVWLNSGINATTGYYFTTTSTVAMGSAPTSLALADIDNDGDLDLLTTNASSTAGAVYVCRNSGNGTFGNGYTTVAVGLQPSELALADLDGDGDLDLLTANAGAASVSVRLNNGSGTFSGTTTLALPAGSTPSGLRTGDLDADGDLDLLVAQGKGGRLITFLNTAGTLAPQGRALRLSRDAALATVGVTLGDVDGDGDLDAITSDDQGNVLLSRNVGPPPALPAPVITSLTPDSGPVGATITLAGANLTDVTGVFFNGLTAPGFVLSGTGSSLSVAVPAGASSGPITVVTEDAGTASSPAPFTVTVPVPVLLTSITPGRNASNVTSGTPVVATFAAPITAATAGQLRVFGSQRRGRQPGTTTGGGTATLSFTPDQNFAPGELLSVSIPSSLRAPDGNAVSPQVVQFTAAVGGTGRHDFFTTSTLPLAGADGLRLGDLDADGDLDLVAPGGSQGVLIQLNMGTGTFASGPSLASPGPADVLALGDVDADGDLDILSYATSIGSSTTIWLNDGRGTFARAGSLTVGGSVTQLRLADLDADGDQDLLAVAGNVVSMLLNNGNGTFAAKRDFSFGLTVYDLALGDLDADGDLDLVLPGIAGYYTVAIALNNGTGSFSAAASLALPSDGVSRVALGDVDADGDLDLALASYINYEQRVLIRLNDGRARFGAATASLLLAGPSLVLADSDADGDLDVITGLGVGLNGGTGSFPQVVKMADAGTSATLAVVGDLDGDGDLDLLSNDLAGLVRVRLNRPGPPPTLTGLAPGSGPVGSSVRLTGTNLSLTTAVTFNGTPAASYSAISATQLIATVPAGAGSGFIALLTPAGTATTATAFTVTRPLAATRLSPARNAPSAPRPAVIGLTFAQAVSSASAAELRVAGNRGSGRLAGTLAGGGTTTLTFTPSRAVAAGEVVSVTIPDRLTGTDGSKALRQTYQFTAAAGGTGTGLFLPGADGRPFAAYGSRYSFAVGDIDADGDPDLVTTTGFVRFNNGEGTFADSAEYELFAGATSPARRVALADLDGDGDLDLLSSNGNLFFNAGQGTFARQPVIAGLGDMVHDLALGDLDSDGDLDLVAPNYARDSVYVLFNDGAGRFPARLAVAVGSRPAGLALGDLDNDGDLDLLTANEGLGTAGSTLSVGFNDGIGWFGTVRTLAAGTGLGQVVLGDVDGDLDLDLVTNNGLLQLNDGLGGFATSQSTPAGQGVALADIDADGDLDLVVAGAGATALRRNDGRGQFGGSETVNLGSSSQGHDPVLADLDNDGDLDMLTANAANNTVYLSLNQRVALPQLVSFAPASELPGATVVLTGTDFIGTTSVLFNGVPATSFSVVTAARIVVQVPAGATSGLVQLGHPTGPASSATAFTVLQPVAVAGISPARNATVPTTARVSATFSQAIPTNTAANLVVFSQQRGGRLGGTRGGAGSPTLTFAPSQPYLPGEQLSVSVPPYTDANDHRVERQVYQFRAAVGGTGRGEMGAPTSLNYGTDRIPVLGDVDGDGDLDLLYLWGTLLQLQRNNGQGAFGDATALLTFPQGTGRALALGDVDGDGDLDLAAADIRELQHSSVVNIRLNDGTGHFTGSLDVPVGDGPFRVALADVDGDGDLDLLTANSGHVSVTTSVRLNDGTGQFNSVRDEYLYRNTNQSYVGQLLGDLNGDGALDQLIYNSASCSLRFNDGLGHFNQRVASLPLSYDFVDLALSDLDGDGDLDLLLLQVNTQVGNGLLMRLNDGKGHFGPAISTGGMPGFGGYDRLAVGDLDADGDPDVVLTGYYIDKGVVLLNDSHGQFSFMQEMPMAGRPIWPMLGDLDGDGDLDLLHATSSEMRTRFNGPGNPLATAPATGTPHLIVYPNPVHGQLVVHLPAALRASGPLRLYSAHGQLVLEQALHLSATGELTLDLAYLPTGLYTLRLWVGDKLATEKISIL